MSTSIISSTGSSSSHSSGSSESEDDFDRPQKVRNSIREKIVSKIKQCITELRTPKPRQKRRHCDRDHVEAHQRLFNDYFAPEPLYSEQLFRRRFRMRKHLFLRLVNATESTSTFFTLREDACNKVGLSALQKCTAVLRILAYGESSDRVDEYLRIADSTARTCLKEFTDVIINQFGEQYLRSPSVEDLQSILLTNARRGFPGMIGSIDCMHWEWKNCPIAWQGQFQGRGKAPTVILEAVASEDLWIWHSFFGVPGTCNDLNVLHRSPIFEDVMNGRAPGVNYVVNGHQYNMPYYLTDDIYPKWATFIQSVPNPQTPKEILFAERQEAVRKDVERAFGVLQARFAFIRKPALTWDERMLSRIMKTCIILHNMIVEDERNSYCNYKDPSEFTIPENESSQSSVHNPEYNMGHINNIHAYLANRETVQDRSTHMALKKDLIENIWGHRNVA